MAENDESAKLIVEAAEGERESKPPKTQLASTIKSWGVLIASLAALVTALGAIFKPQDHSVTQASYEETSKTLQKVEEQEMANHDDIVSIRQYLADQEKQPLESQHTTPAPSLRPLTRPPPAVHAFVRPSPPPPFAQVLTAAAR